jgi:molybdate transport repressor ModE-like protein
MDIELGLSWRLGRGHATAVEPRLFALLEAIREQGSLNRGARQVGVSYRSAWDLLQAWSRQLGQPLVHLERGRGARLTPLGEKLLWAEQQARQRLAPLLADLGAELRDALDAVGNRSQAGELSISASHSLAHELLRDIVRRTTRIELRLQNAGSLESLQRFNEGKFDLAGFHIVEGELRDEMARHYHALLDADKHVLIRVAARRQGLIVARGNPKRIRTLRDLARGGIRFVNRQAGSGTRLLLDALLRREGVDARGIAGYENEEFTHSATAALLASGAADAALGIEAAARRFDLDFVPFATETYYFAARKAALSSPPIDGLVSALSSAEFRRGLRAMAGYDPTDSGRCEPCAI